jgi:uncharacterized protein YciI
MLFFVYGLDRENVGAQLLELAEAHWSYIDAFAERLVVRGPTLTDDGTAHSGSLHVLELPDRAAVEHFAFNEPYWLAGLYRDVTISRVESLLDRTIGDRTALPEEQPSSLVIGRWRPSPAANVVEHATGRLGRDDRLVFCGLLVDDIQTHTLGIVSMIDAEPGEATRHLQSVADAAAGGHVLLTAQRWRRGGRSTTPDPPNELLTG